MSQLKTVERLNTVKLRLDRFRRAALARLLLSPALRWRYGAPVADELLIIPRDLRAADPCFLDEFQNGQFGLAGYVADLKGGSPYAIEQPSLRWSRELHGFAWLRHLRADRTDEADSTARDLVEQWIRRERHRTGVAWEPAVVARRIISWITSSHMLLSGDHQERYDRITDSLADQVIHLSATWRDAPHGYPRLLAVTGLLYADLCVAGRDRNLAVTEQVFSSEIEHQILPDGGHISRNPALLIDIVLDLLPVNQCFKSRSRTPPAALQKAIDRMLLMVQYMRMGDGTLARFNGVGPPSDDAVATAMAYLPIDATPLREAPQSRYTRLVREDSIVLADTGPPPPIAFSGDAHAGCLSFEFSSAGQVIFMNGGAPGLYETEWRPASRATASHNTLALGAMSSARLINDKSLEELIGATPLRYPERVTCSCTETAEGITLSTSHDGYQKTIGLIHNRSLTLSNNGTKLSGCDQLAAPARIARLRKDVPFSIHFHLSKHVNAELGRKPDTVTVTLPSGERWLLEISCGVISIEDSVHFADLSGVCAAEQIIIRGACPGETTICWTFERIREAPASRFGDKST